MTFAQSALRDASSGSAPAHEHTLALNAWTAATGSRRMAAILGAVRRALHDEALVLDGHHLVNLRHELSEIRRLDDGERLIGNMRFRAVTEPL